MIFSALLGVCILGLPPGLAGQAVQFSGTALNFGGYFSGDGSGCASVTIRLEEVVGSGANPTSVVAVSFSIAHDPALLVVTGIESSPALIGYLGFTPQTFVETCSGGGTVGIIFAPDMVTTPTPLTLATAMDIAVIHYQTKPIAFVGMTTQVETEISWVANACGAAIPVANGVTTSGGSSQLPIASLVPGTLTLTPGYFFVRGNANGDASASSVDIADVVYTLGFLFSGGPAPSCMRAADANDDEAVDLGDAVFILAGLFSGGPPPSSPYPTCGSDPTLGGLTCDGFPACCPPDPPQIPGLIFAGYNAQGYGEFELEIDPSGVVGPIRMILIPAGTFNRGQVGVPGAEPVHSVTLTKDFLISKYEITNVQYRHFCDQTGFPYPPSPSCCGVPNDHFTDPAHADHPVLMVSWNDLTAAGGFLDWAGLVLPTEAQWEYAARGTTGSTYPWGDEAPDASSTYRANYCQWNGSSCTTLDAWLLTNVVDDFAGFAGPFGTVGQAGNVHEWCYDRHGVYPSESATDPTGPLTGFNRILRGGSFGNDVTGLQSALRHFDAPTLRIEVLGFRPVRLIP